MIALKVEPYCKKCEHFSPDVTIARIFGDGMELVTEHTITCYDADKCRYLKEMFKQFEKENEK